MTKTICYVDDDTDELERFKNSFKDSYDVVTGHNYKDCKDKLRQRKLDKPDIWVLDLFFPRDGVINSPEQLSGLNQKYHQLCRSIRSFRSQMTDLGQDLDAGIDLLRKCEKDKVPAVILTRKGTLDDAIRCIDEGAARVLRKPMPTHWPQNVKDVKNELDNAMRSGAPRLTDYFEEVISKYSHWNKFKHWYMLFIGSVIGLILENLISLVKLL
jgi:DNA-binding NtrC family response regulator